MKGPQNSDGATASLTQHTPEASMLTAQGGSWTHQIQVQGPLPLPMRQSFTLGLGRSTGPSPCTGLLLGPGQGLSCPPGVSCHLPGTRGAKRGKETGE